MADDRYNRWQGLAIGQLTVAIALISSLSVAGLGAGFVLLQSSQLLLCTPLKYAFPVSLLFLFLAVLLSSGAVITRLLDFRLTARKVRKDTKPDYDKPLTIFWLGRDTYGCITWALFWASCLLFAVGLILLFTSIAAMYANRLL